MPGRRCALHREATPGHPDRPDCLRLLRRLMLIRAVAPRPHPKGTCSETATGRRSHPPRTRLNTRGADACPHVRARWGQRKQRQSESEGMRGGRVCGDRSPGSSAAGRGGARGPARRRRNGGTTTPSFRGRRRQSLSGSVVIIGSRGVRGPPRLDVVGAVPVEALRGEGREGGGGVKRWLEN